ncbi:hypothetical protein EW026_g953 [Hermanssonia centrifuga]|uniref:Uncharacterized protein n=1 Tax=Hermanssonia centrifuga TaxID=98765 RepID=A0A4S4KXN7_9APHY|nr:hypothetical protein EW026_g953 [Hermanssonia centrifuga]
MDRAWTQQMAEIVKNTNEAEVIAYDVGEVRLQYHEEMAKMRITCHDVLSTVQALGADTELCQREGVALVQQENKILALSDEIKRMEASYKEKVVAVLEETKRLVELCDKTRDLDD